MPTTLDNRIQAALDGSTVTAVVDGLQDASSARSKAIRVLDIIQKSNFNAKTAAIVNIGGADGVELEHILLSSESNYGLLLEFDDELRARADEKATKLLNLHGKQMKVLSGDAFQKAPQAIRQLEQWRDDGHIQSVVLTIHAVLHEFPNRGSKTTDIEGFISPFLKIKLPILVIVREPCMPDDLPPVVYLSAKCNPVLLAKLAAQIKNAHPEFNTESDPVSMAQKVRMGSRLAIETIQKLFYLESFKYEIEERNTSFKKSEFVTFFTNVFGAENVRTETMQTDSFDNFWKEHGIELTNSNNSILKPELHVRIIAKHVPHEILSTIVVETKSTNISHPQDAVFPDSHETQDKRRIDIQEKNAPTVPVLLVMNPEPFKFPNGKCAYSVLKLAEICRQEQIDAIKFLMQEDFENWLSYCKEFGAAHAAKKARCLKDKSNANRLKYFLDHIDPPRSAKKPVQAMGLAGTLPVIVVSKSERSKVSELTPMLKESDFALFKETLYEGGYNLLFGSGISLDSKNGADEPLLNEDALRRKLYTLLSAPASTSLSRAFDSLKQNQIDAEIVAPYLDCKPGPSVAFLPKYLWKRIFTFNIDDVLENLYQVTSNSKQNLKTINYCDDFDPVSARAVLAAIHLHGWVKKKDDGFAFSHNQYATKMRVNNPWMLHLSQILATESFIISGSSLNEIDLEYYLGFRNQITPRRGKGPSLLIEPCPDVTTKSICEKHSLILIPHTLREFSDWLSAVCPSPPSLADLVVPNDDSLFDRQVSQSAKERFFQDFELVRASDQPLPKTHAPFLYGSEPKWHELDQHYDIIRSDNEKIFETVDKFFSPGNATKGSFLLLLDDAGTGKTTTAKRIAHDVALSGKTVFSVKTLSRIDVEVAEKCLRGVTTKALLLVDSLADHAEQLAQIFESETITNKVFILATERSYRARHLDLTLPTFLQQRRPLSALTVNECGQLIERYRKFGLVGQRRAIKHPELFSEELARDPISIAICRILNDFKPLDAIIESLWNATSEEQLFPYLCVALAQHCYRDGIRYSILRSICGAELSIGKLFKETAPLRIVENTSDDEFLLAANSVIAERILTRSVEKNGALLLDAFFGISRSLAPYVNRQTSRDQTPEVRLSGRLFDSDTIVKPLLGDKSGDFFAFAQREWEWNSRYWEQRALYEGDIDLELGIRYARQAVAIENYAFPLTTLGKLLVRSMEKEKSLANRKAIFQEAFEKLSAAIEMEMSRTLSNNRRRRIAIHPFVVLLNGAIKFREIGGILTTDQVTRLSIHANQARQIFPNDIQMKSIRQRFDVLYK